VIPPNILSRAKGLAIFTVVKAGFLFSGRAGSGIVVARLPGDQGWSAPSCIATEVTDFVVVLNSDDAVKAFSHGGNVTLGGNLSVAAGPIGRNAEAAGTVNNMAAIFSYSKTRGLFAGVSIEGSVIIERKDANAKFYGRKVSAKELLSGAVPPPKEADPLYAALFQRASASPKTGSPPPLKAKPKIRPFATHQSTGSTSQSSAYGTQATMKMPDETQYNQYTYPHSVPSPYTAPSPPSPPSPPPPPRPRPAAPAQDVVIALYDFPGEQPTDLPFKVGDRITVIQRTESTNDWWRGSCNGREGMFPANYVQHNN
jgi:lipid-binding SYLF domain-containing protein